jgi:diguanylate cyclase (GGDEF)-like protein/PAS domain S-box-containing protein
MDNCLIVFDRQKRVVDVNPAVLRMMRLLRPDGKPVSQADLIGRPVDQAFSVCPHLVAELQKGQEGRFELQVRSQDQCMDLELRISAVREQARGQVGWMAILNDITALKAAREEALLARDRALQVAAENSVLYEQMRQMALTDPLTGLSTRRHFFNLAALAFEWAVKNHQPLSAVMLDIDHFKQINDRYGHAIGDRVLERVARTCQDALRKSDAIGRYGGEEFIILLPDTGRERAIQIAERLRARIDQLNFASQNGLVGVTVSLGAAEFAGEGDRLEDMIERADRGMYAAKRAGRNQVKFTEFLPALPATPLQ